MGPPFDQRQATSGDCAPADESPLRPEEPAAASRGLGGLAEVAALCAALALACAARLSKSNIQYGFLNLNCGCTALVRIWVWIWIALHETGLEVKGDMEVRFFAHIENRVLTKN